MSRQTAFIIFLIVAAIALFLVFRSVIKEGVADSEKRGQKLERAASEKTPPPGPDGKPQYRGFGAAQKNHARENAARSYERPVKDLEQVDPEAP